MQFEVGTLLKAQNDMEGALAAYQRAVVAKPRLIEAHAAIGEIQLEKEDYFSAIVTFRRVINLDPENANAYYNLGVGLLAQQRKSEAIAAFEQARDLYKQQGKTEELEKTKEILQELK